MDNDPIDIAMEEIKALFPFAMEPSITVSIGTGSSRNPNDALQMSISTWRDLIFPWRNTFFFRLARVLIASMSKRRSRGGGKGEYFRFDIGFDGKEPRLDDISKMHELKAMVRSAIQKSTDIDRLARCMIAELFLFELESIPKLLNGRYSCIGHITCRLRSGTVEFKALMHQLSRSSARFLLGNRPLSGSIEDRRSIDSARNFRKMVSFEVPTRQHSVPIRLREGLAQACNISGSPFTVDWLVAAQGLEMAFGKPNHEKRKRSDGEAWLSGKRRRI